MPTILITGTSTGFGRETARLFLERDWDVIATMRNPSTDVLPASPRLRIVPLDVTDDASIARAVEASGPVDALVNNAGVGLLNALEGSLPASIKTVFETNTLGTIAVTQAFLPQFRERRGGVVVNITSAVTYAPLPLLSVYTASKAAVEAFTECLVHEFEPFGIRARLVLPGSSPDTRFGKTAQALMGEGSHPAYADLVQKAFAALQQQRETTRPLDVAEAVWRAVTDPGTQLRIPAGADAMVIAAGQG